MTIRGQVRHAFPAFKVFVFGVDVTEDVLDVSVTWDVSRAPNRCSFTLANLDDKYIYTTEDLKVIFDDDLITQAIKIKRERFLDVVQRLYKDVEPDSEDIDNLILENVQNITPEIKRTVIERKITKRLPNVSAREVDGQVSTLKPLIGNAFRYPFQAEDPIFHSNDPIRIFYRDPFNPRRWYHMFAGLVSDFDDNVDENNQKLLTIMGEGPTKLFRYARVTFNPGIIDIAALEQQEIDVVIRTFWQSGLSKLTLPELLFFMVFGNNPEDGTKFSLPLNSSVGDAVAKANVNGIGNFNYQRSAVVEFGPSTSGGIEDSSLGISPNSIENLSEWQSLIDHEVKITDLKEMAIKEFDGSTYESEVIRFSDGTPDPSSIIDIIGQNTQHYPVDGGRLLMLIPASFHPSINREVLLDEILQNPAMNTEFSSRLRIILDTIERIEFLFYESPKGDLVCEFPLYDFDPDDWTTEQDIYHLEVKNQSLYRVVNATRGPFAGRYSITKKETINFSKNITDEKVRTQVIGHWGYIQNMLSLGTSKEIQPGAVITLKHLVPLYGLRLEQIDPKAFVSSKEAAYTYAHLTLNKMNADSRTLGINALPNFGSWLNRPFYFEERNCIGTTLSLTHSIKWGMGGSVDTRININHIRGWDGLIDENGNAVYSTIGGIPSQPLNYKVLFNLVNTDSGNNTGTPSTG